MRNEEKRKRLKRFAIIFSVLVSVVLMVFLGFEIFKRSAITKIEVSSTDITCTNNDQIIKFIESLNLNYYSYKKDGLELELKKKFYCIGNMTSDISYPDKLKIGISGRKAVLLISAVNTNFDINPMVVVPDDFKIATQSSLSAQPLKIIDKILTDSNQASASGYFLVDEEGMVFDRQSGDVSVPKLRIIGGQLKIGEKIKGGLIAKVKEIIEGLKGADTLTDNLVIIGDRLIVNSKPRIIFSLNKRLDYQIASLQLILTQAKMNSDPNRAGSGGVESIDLRFNKPVVVYSKVKN